MFCEGFWFWFLFLHRVIMQPLNCKTSDMVRGKGAIVKTGGPSECLHPGSRNSQLSSSA